MNPSLLLGKSTEMMIASRLLAENREVYLPCVDDHGVDIIVRTKDFDKSLPDSDPRSYEFQEIQVKSVSRGGIFVFSCTPRPNYWFVFYNQSSGLTWLIPSEELPTICSINKTGKNIGKYSLDLKATNKTPIKHKEYVSSDFSSLA